MSTTAHDSRSGLLPAGLFLALLLVMAATRLHHFSAVPDATWAVFLAAGFWLRGKARWAFPALMAAAVAVDAYAISGTGLGFWSHYCVSAAYWFLLPGYGALWLGGSWLARHADGGRMRDAGLAFGVVVVAASACFLVSNGSFYWLSGVVAERSFGGWFANLGHWYLPFLRSTLLWLAPAALVQLALRATGRSPVVHAAA